MTAYFLSEKRVCKIGLDSFAVLAVRKFLLNKNKEKENSGVNIKKTILRQKPKIGL